MKRLNQRWITAALAGGVCLLTTVTTQALDVFLRAAPTAKIMPDSRTVPMWGFAQDTSAFGQQGALSSPGPGIAIAANDGTLRIALDNRLPEAVSLVIPGLPPPEVRRGSATGTLLTGHTRITLLGDDRDRARSLVPETPVGNLFAGSTTPEQVWYIWSNVPPGTYLYHSGSHVALQVEMGLYGAVTKRAGRELVYAGKSYNQRLDITLLFSEVDADLHDAVAAGDFGPDGSIKSTIDSRSQYYLINGQAYDPGNPNLATIALPERPTPDRPALLRLLNAGHGGRVPIVNQSELTIIAEDSRPSDYPRSQYSVQLPSLKTIDALWPQATAGAFAVYDRALGLANNKQQPGGMLVHLQVP